MKSGAQQDSVVESALRAENKASAGRSGFTLLELLSVMAIMVVLMGIAGASYYGMSRGASLRGASSNLRSTLSLARQYAATRRASTHVLLWQDADGAYYRTFVEAGTDTGPLGDRLEVFGRGLSGDDVSLVGGVMYRLHPWQTGDVYDEGFIKTNKWDPDQRKSWVIATNGQGQTLQWFDGDIGGWAIRSKGRLPAGIRYDKDWQEVVFKPDGTAENQGPITITVSEARGAGSRRITVKAFTGLVVEG